MTGQHFLVVHDDPADGMEIEHPDTCLQTVLYGVASANACAVGAMEQEYGLELFFSRGAKPHPFFGVREVVTPGRHLVEYWLEEIKLPPHIGGVEYDHGLTIPDPAVAS